MKGYNAPRLRLKAVARWYPGRGTATWAPPVRLFYSSKVRASIGWWKDNAASKSVLRILSAGVKLDFVAGKPPPPLRFAPLLVAEIDTEFALDDLAKGDSLGAYQPLVPGGADYLSRTRVHTQPNGKRRVVHNYRVINAACTRKTCRYESVKDLPSLLRPNDWLLSLDLSAAFWHVPLHRQSARYLSFHFALPLAYTDSLGQRHETPRVPGSYIVDDYMVVERSCAALPFGYTNSPFIFTKVVKVIARAMRAANIKCLWFLDDCLLALPSKARALQARDFVEQLLLRSGFQKAPDKGQWAPAQSLPDHLGYHIDTRGPRGLIRVPVRRCIDISSAAKDLLCRASRDARRVPTQLLRRFIGKAASVAYAVRQARLWLRSLHDICELFRPCSRLDRAALRDLQAWVDFHVNSPANGMPLWPGEPTRAIYTDASGSIGFGSVVEAPPGARTRHGYLFQKPNLPGTFATDAAGGGRQRGAVFSGGFWTDEERLLYHITLKELIAVRHGVLAHREVLRGCVCRLWEDNAAVVHIINNRTSRSPALMAELRALLHVLDELDIDLRPRYIRSHLNPADYFSRMTNRDAWSLRPGVQRMVLRQARKLLRRPVSLDPFACRQSAVCKRYASRVADPEALQLDGFALSWGHESGSVWLNPPWASIPACIDKLRQEGPAAIFIVPSWPTQAWWPALLELGGHHLRLLRPKLAVRSHHGRLVEPFLNHGVELLAVVIPRR